MVIIDALEKLGFTFWQVVVVFVLIYLREDIKKLISRVSALKIGDNEITLQKNADVVGELNLIKAELGDNVPAQVNRIIEEKIDKRVLGALINIKKNTTYLWSDIRNRESERVESFIRGKTFLRVKDDINLLENAGIIEYTQSRSHDAFDSDHVLKLSIEIKNSTIDKFIKQADEF